MFDNFIVNIRTIFPKANDNRDSLDSDYSNECAMAFLEQSANRTASIANENANRTMLNIVRSYFTQLYHKKAASDVDNDIMLPRAYNYSDLHFDWDPVELKAKEKFIEDIDNVIDKFVRVITINDTNSPRRTDCFYVHDFVFIDYFLLFSIEIY